jgi:hypothetical protein
MKKNVDIQCYRPFHYNKAHFAGFCHNIIVDTRTICVALENKAKVTELCADGSKVALGFDNYDKDNGGVVPEDTRTEDETDTSNIYTVTSITPNGNAFKEETKIRGTKTINVTKIKEEAKPAEKVEVKKEEEKVEVKKEEKKVEVKEEKPSKMDTKADAKAANNNSKQ